METNRKKCEVHMLPTENESNIWLWKIRNKLKYYGSESFKPVKPGKSGKPQHLYITSDDEIQDGDWCTDGSKVIKANSKIVEAQGLADRIEWRKIIATTDYNLYITIGELYNSYNKDLPKPSQAFIKKYCELGGIDEVMVEYTSKDWDSRTKDIMMGYGDNPDNFEKELKPKTNTHNEIAIHTVKNSWSKEEVIDLLDQFNNRGGWADPFRNGEEFDQWIKENL